MTVPPQWTIARLQEAGFEGFGKIADLTPSDIPTAPGVYVVARVSGSDPTFLESSPAGHFKGKDPTAAIIVLKQRWVQNTDVIYIGKATAGRTARRGLRARLDEYLRFGAGQPIGHWGGRYIWQLQDSSELLVGWRQSNEPTELETEMIREFATLYGVLPFANLRR